MLNRNGQETEHLAQFFFFFFFFTGSSITARRRFEVDRDQIVPQFERGPRREQRRAQDAEDRHREPERELPEAPGRG